MNHIWVIGVMLACVFIVWDSRPSKPNCLDAQQRYLAIAITAAVFCFVLVAVGVWYWLSSTTSWRL